MLVLCTDTRIELNMFWLITQSQPPANVRISASLPKPLPDAKIKLGFVSMSKSGAW